MKCQYCVMDAAVVIDKGTYTVPLCMKHDEKTREMENDNTYHI